MRNLFASIRDWYRPRKQQSLLGRWWRTAVMTLPAWPIMHMFFPGPWYQGIGSVLGYSFLYALGDYAYFNVYGGTEKEYPNTPESDYWKRWFP